MPTAEVTGAPKALGQDMLEQQPQKAGAGEGAGFGAAGFAVSLAEGDLAVVAGAEVLLLEHPPVQVAAQLDQGLFPRAAGLTVGAPLLGMAFRQVQSGLGHGRQQLGPEPFG